MSTTSVVVTTALFLAGAVALATSAFVKMPAVAGGGGDEQVAVTTVIVREVQAAQRKAETEMLLRIEARTTHEIGAAFDAVATAKPLRW